MLFTVPFETKKRARGVHGSGSAYVRGSMTESGHDADDDAMEQDTLLGMGDHHEMDASDNDLMEGFDEGVK